MLVLSRRVDQQIVFPNLDVKLQVLQIKGKVIKLGIDAPSDVPIVRPEAANPAQSEGRNSLAAHAGIDRHLLRNRLNAINLGLRLFQKQTDLQLHEDSRQTMQRVIDELQKLDNDVGTARSQSEPKPQKQPLNLLVVDDDDNERELLVGLLKLYGFAVASATNGSEAIDYLQNNSLPDYVLLDMKMPETDGAATIEKIRGDARLAGLKVLAVSGSSPDEFGVETGCNGWFPKPLDPERLIAAMTREQAVTRPLI